MTTLSPGANAARETRLAHRELNALRQRGHSRRHTVWLTQIRAFGFHRRLGAGGASRAVVVVSVNRRAADRGAATHTPRFLRDRVEPRLMPRIARALRVWRMSIDADLFSYCYFDHASSSFGRQSRTPNPNPNQEHQHSSHDHLKGGPQKRCVHVAVSNPADEQEFNSHDHDSRDGRGAEVRD